MEATELAVTDSAETPTSTLLQSEPDSAPKRVVGRPFVKGQSGNPAGKPRKSESYIEQLKWERAKRVKKLAQRAVEAGLSENGFLAIKAQAYLRDTLDGLPAQKLIVQREDDPAVGMLAELMQGYLNSGLNSGSNLPPDAPKLLPSP